MTIRNCDNLEILNRQMVTLYNGMRVEEILFRYIDSGTFKYSWTRESFESTMVLGRPNPVTHIDINLDQVKVGSHHNFLTYLRFAVDKIKKKFADYWEVEYYSCWIVKGSGLEILADLIAAHSTKKYVFLTGSVDAKE